jgi:hypothetical protein
MYKILLPIDISSTQKEQIKYNHCFPIKQRIITGLQLGHFISVTLQNYQQNSVKQD